MKKKLLVTNIALFLVADLAVTGYILNKINKKSNEIIAFVKPPVSVKVETTTPTDEFTIAETVEETIPITEETQPLETEPEVEVEKQEIGEIVNETTLYANASHNALDISNLEVTEKVYKILSEANGYDLIRTDDNKIGFIRSEDVTYTGEEIESPYKIKRKNDFVITTASVLNFRYGPSTEYESFRGLQPNTELQVLGETNDNWLLVHLNGETGFIKKDYTISVLDIIKEKYPDININELKVQKVVELRDGLNYRRGPGTDYPIIREFNKSETMRVLAEYDGWYFGFTDDYEVGFVSKQYAKDLEGIFIDTDILTQRMRMYNNNELYYYTRVKTGADITPTTEGHFKIDWMGQNENIVDDIVVNYWMHYYDGEGIHDLESCTSYGEDDYHYAGSHGCTRTPLENVAKIYSKASRGTHVIVHK